MTWAFLQIRSGPGSRFPPFLLCEKVSVLLLIAELPQASARARAPILSLDARHHLIIIIFFSFLASLRTYPSTCARAHARYRDATRFPLRSWAEENIASGDQGCRAPVIYCDSRRSTHVVRGRIAFLPRSLRAVFAPARLGGAREFPGCQDVWHITETGRPCWVVRGIPQPGKKSFFLSVLPRLRINQSVVAFQLFPAPLRRLFLVQGSSHPTPVLGVCRWERRVCMCMCVCARESVCERECVRVRDENERRVRSEKNGERENTTKKDLISSTSTKPEKSVSRG